MKVVLVIVSMVFFCIIVTNQCFANGLSLQANTLTIATQAPTHVQKSFKIKNTQQAVKWVKGQYAAKVLSVRSTHTNGRSGYSLKLLSAQGVIFYVSVDAKTGQIRRN